MRHQPPESNPEPGTRLRSCRRPAAKLGAHPGDVLLLARLRAARCRDRLCGKIVRRASAEYLADRWKSMFCHPASRRRGRRTRHCMAGKPGRPAARAQVEAEIGEAYQFSFQRNRGSSRSGSSACVSVRKIRSEQVAVVVPRLPMAGSLELGLSRAPAMMTECPRTSAELEAADELQQHQLIFSTIDPP